MKTTYTSLWTVLISTSLWAQTATNAPVPIPMTDPAPAPMAAAAPATLAPSNAPAAKPAIKKPAAKTVHKKKPAHPKGASTAARKPATHVLAAKSSTPAAGASAKLVNLVPGPAVVTGHTINVRGRASLRGEVISKLKAGDAVTVIESIAVEKPKPGEPAQWAKIAFPTNAQAWVFAEYVDPTNKTVLPPRLNLRAGPSENYSVIGTLSRGEPVNEVLVKANWMQIVPPTNAFAFVAAELLKQEAPEAPAAPPPAVTTPTPLPTTPEVAAAPTQTNVVTAPVAIAAPPADTNLTAVTTNIPPTLPPAPETTNTVAPPVTPPVATTPSEPSAPVVELPPAKRIVEREGIVRGTWSIQAPSPVELANPDTGQTMDYLYTPSTQVNLKRYKGLRVRVTGEEGLDSRWKNVPVLTIQKIQVLE